MQKKKKADGHENRHENANSVNPGTQGAAQLFVSDTHLSQSKDQESQKYLHVFKQPFRFFLFAMVFCTPNTRVQSTVI